MAEEEVKEEVPVEEVPVPKAESSLDSWIPKTGIGKKVFAGEIKSIEEVLNTGKRIREPEIVDKLLPGLKSELILIGGRVGKGGGIQRIPIRITSTTHKSGRRFRMNAFVVVGNEDGILGIGSGKAPDPKEAVDKATRRAKLNLIKIKRGCGSWECGCGTEHSIPFKTKGKCGSVRVVMMPAPKGVGLVADDESKKMLKLAGIKDVWLRTFGNTSMRISLLWAVFDSLKKLYVYERVDV